MSSRARLAIAAGAAGAVAAGVLLAIALSRWIGEPREEHPPGGEATSHQVRGDAAKVDLLGRYLKLLSPVESAEFTVAYDDNCPLGPSDWDIRAVLKVAPADIPRWTAEMEPAGEEGVDLA